MKLRTILLGTIAGIFMVSVASSTEIGALDSGGCATHHAVVAMDYVVPSYNTWF